MENILTASAGTLLIGFTILNFILYHTVFRVIYIGSMRKSITSELIWCIIFACLEVAILIKVGQTIFKVVGIIVVLGILIVGVYRAFELGKEVTSLLKKDEKKNSDNSVLMAEVENTTSENEKDILETESTPDKKEQGGHKKPGKLIKIVAVVILVIAVLTGKFDNFSHESSDHGKTDNQEVTAVDTNTDDALLQEIERENEFIEGMENRDFGVSEYKLYENVLIHAADLYGTGNGNKYTVCDIDADGTIELIVSHGTSDADWVNDVYTIDGGEVIHIGWFNNYSSLYYSDMSVTNDGEGIISVTGRHGIESIDQIKKVGNQITVENVVYREVEDDLYYGNEMFIYTQSIEDMTLLLDTFIDSQGW